MSSKAARHNKRNWEKAGDDEVASPRCIRAVKPKVEGADEAADLDLLSNVASSSEKTVRTKSLGVSDEGGSIYEEIRREDFADEAATSEKISPTKEGSEKAYTSFPDRLMELLESEEDAIRKAIWWLPSGGSFAISPTHFNGKILSRFFRGIRFAQLLQKLSRWYVLLQPDACQTTARQPYTHHSCRLRLDLRVEGVSDVFGMAKFQEPMSTLTTCSDVVSPSCSRSMKQPS